MPYSKQAAMAKMFASDTAMWVTTEAVQIFGGYGYTREFPVKRMAIQSSLRTDTLFEIVEKAEKAKISEALAKCKGNKAKAANLLGISRQGLYKKLNKYGLND